MRHSCFLSDKMIQMVGPLRPSSAAGGVGSREVLSDTGGVGGGGYSGLPGILADRPTDRPIHIRKVVLRGKMKFIKGAENGGQI